MPCVHSLSPDLQAKAVELEHEMFRNAKMANLYKASVLKKVGPGQGVLLGWGGRASPHTLPGCVVALLGGHSHRGGLTALLCWLEDVSSQLCQD